MDQNPTYEELGKKARDPDQAESDRDRFEGELILLQTAVENAAESFEITDARGNIQYVNPAFERITGYSLKELLGKNPRILSSGKHGREFYRSMWGDLTQGRVWKGTLINRKKDGTLFEEAATILSVKNSMGRTTHYVAVKRDITANLSLERQLFQAQKMEALGTLVAGLTHEINNPVNSIMLSAPTIKKVWMDLQPDLTKCATGNPDKKYGGLTVDFLNENMAILISDIELAADRISRLIHDLKNYAKITDQVERKKISINDAVENALRLSQTTIRKAGIFLKTALGEGLPSINGNLQNIEQIVMNLILNAVDAIKETGKDEGTIRVATKLEKRKGMLAISISDNGMGIDPSISGQVFDPFFSSKQSRGGTGLGLSVTYNLVKAHDGEITFESEPGKGTTFYVRFPLYKTEKLYRILVANDDEGIQKLIMQSIGSLENTIIETVSNGTETLIKIGTFKPDLLILDVFMPKIDGIEVCGIIRNDPALKEMEVIIITGSHCLNDIKILEKLKNSVERLME